MGKVTQVPITPEVLDWAIGESGYTIPEVADAAGVDVADLNAWLNGRSRPGVTAVRSLAQTLRRPVAAFLLPRPPGGEGPDVRFRHMPGVPSRELTPNERRYIRKAARLQRMIAWLVDEMREPGARLPTAHLDDDPQTVASACRDRLRITVTTQLAWTSASVAFDAWRSAVEDLGVVVFLSRVLLVARQGARYRTQHGLE
jgi:transcriptional regulator with XRE-family HTH domain